MHGGNGEGPTVLFTNANHGDECEGPVALWDLAHILRAETIDGRVIIVPAMNYPAFRAGRRTSPIDGGNLNRVFPDDSAGTLTEKIADYFFCQLLPMADYVVDFHSGGRTLEFVPFCCVHVLSDAVRESCNLEMPDQDCYVFSESTGLFEPCIDLGTAVKAGDLIARIHDVERTGAAPAEFRAKIDGVLAGKHFPGNIATVAVPASGWRR